MQEVGPEISDRFLGGLYIMTEPLWSYERITEALADLPSDKFGWVDGGEYVRFIYAMRDQYEERLAELEGVIAEQVRLRSIEIQGDDDK